MKKVCFIVACCFCMLFVGCSDDANTNSEREEQQEQKVYPGVYEVNINLSAEEGGNNSSVVRGIDREHGYFTNEYPYDYIYLHSADSDESNHKVLKFELENDPECEDCEKCIRMEIEVKEDGSYTVRHKGQTSPSIELNANQNVYFSTIESIYWKATKIENTSLPVPEQYLPEFTKTKDIFSQDKANAELLRSIEYTKDELIELSLEYRPVIKMSRHCTAFRVHVIFTDLNYPTEFSSKDWEETVGSSYENFYIKLYFGPNFCHTYDLFNNSVPSTDQGGYYSSMYQDEDNPTAEYQRFRRSDYTTTGGSGSTGFYGVGYMTEENNYLMAPLNRSISGSEFGFYVFIKFTEDSSPDLIGEDGGVVNYFKATIPDFTLETNRVHYITFVYSREDLKPFVEYAKNAAGSRSVSEPKEIQLTPIKVIVE